MLKKTLTLLLAAFMVCSLVACGKSSSQEEVTQSTDNVSVQEQTETADTASTSESADIAPAIGTVANTLAEDEDTLIATYADKFEQKTYTDSESGLSIYICRRGTMHLLLIRWWSLSVIPAVQETMPQYP